MLLECHLQVDGHQIRDLQILLVRCLHISKIQTHHLTHRRVQITIHQLHLDTVHQVQATVQRAQSTRRRHRISVQLLPTTTQHLQDILQTLLTLRHHHHTAQHRRSFKGQRVQFILHLTRQRHLIHLLRRLIVQHLRRIHRHRQNIHHRVQIIQLNRLNIQQRRQAIAHRVQITLQQRRYTRQLLQTILHRITRLLLHLIHHRHRSTVLQVQAILQLHHHMVHHLNIRLKVLRVITLHRRHRIQHLQDQDIHQHILQDLLNIAQLHRCIHQQVLHIKKKMLNQVQAIQVQQAAVLKKNMKSTRNGTGKFSN
jgi:hypothetical protein